MSYWKYFSNEDLRVLSHFCVFRKLPEKNWLQSSGFCRFRPASRILKLFPLPPWKEISKDFLEICPITKKFFRNLCKKISAKNFQKSLFSEFCSPKRFLPSLHYSQMINKKGNFFCQIYCWTSPQLLSLVLRPSAANFAEKLILTLSFILSLSGSCEIVWAVVNLFEKF